MSRKRLIDTSRMATACLSSTLFLIESINVINYFTDMTVELSGISHIIIAILAIILTVVDLVCLNMIKNLSLDVNGLFEAYDDD